jgi:hypothetical protein
MTADAQSLTVAGEFRQKNRAPGAGARSLVETVEV